MDYDQFIEAVQERASVDSHEEAERIIQATLQTLSERLSSDQLDDLSAHLPSEVMEHLQHEQAGSAEDFPLDEFVDRVSERADARDPEEATAQAQAVMQTVKEAIGGDEEDDDFPLPQDLDPLFGPDVGESGLPGAGG